MKHSVNRVLLGQLCDDLIQVVPETRLDGSGAIIAGLSCDSRQVQPGDLFVAGEGSRDDGLAHVPEAIERGAAAVLASRLPDLPAGIGFVGVPDVARAKAFVADRFFNHPSGRLDVVAITGTNGKTTASHMLRSMLTMDGRGSGLVGTLGAWIGARHAPLANTTPDAIDLQRLLARMVDENLSTVVMEVSSHALVQHRTSCLDVDVGVFTNLSRDHLDYHGTMEAYAAAKARLFDDLSPHASAIVNADDDASPRLVERSFARVTTYGLRADADLRGEILRLDADGTSFRLTEGATRRSLPLTTRLVGRHNVENALAAAGAALALGLPPSAIRTGLEALSAVPGRLQPVDCGQDFRVLVDYAHTPDALEQILSLLRPLTAGRLHVVFGAGGDRDRTKRPLMGRAAGRWADALYVTSDNPRSEDPGTILDEILEGVPQEVRERAERLVDRRAAIEAACRAATGGDIVVIAGKGHETTQTIGSEVIEFDDRTVTQETLWSL